MAKSLNSIIKLTTVSEVVVKMYLLKIKNIYVLIAKQNKGNFYCETAKMTSSIFSSFPLGERGSLGMRYVKIIFSKGIILQDLMKKPMYSTLKIKMDNLPEYIPCESRLRAARWSETEGTGFMGLIYCFLSVIYL